MEIEDRMASEMCKFEENNLYFASGMYILFLDKEKKACMKRLADEQHPEYGKSNFAKKPLRKTPKKSKVKSKEVFCLHQT